MSYDDHMNGNNGMSGLNENSFHSMGGNSKQKDQTFMFLEGCKKNSTITIVLSGPLE
jgi:hypothetical protein